MTNWHNEVFEEMGWLLDAHSKQPASFTMEVSPSVSNPQRCDLCGTRTGLHGFSFDKDGKY